MTAAAPARVLAVPLPTESRLHDRIAPGDFVDCYAADGAVAVRPAAQTIVAFPPWAQVLLRVRRWLTAPFGLAQEGPPSADRLGPFPVELETDDEIVAGFDDRHLDFRVSIMSTKGQVSLATWVRPHNIAGRCYLSVIMPFHILIARNAVARAVRGAVLPTAARRTS